MAPDCFKSSNWKTCEDSRHRLGTAFLNMTATKFRFIFVASLLLLLGWARTAATLVHQVSQMGAEDPVWLAARQVSLLCQEVPSNATIGFIDGQEWQLVDDGLISKFLVQFSLAPRQVFPRAFAMPDDDYVLTHQLELADESRRQLLMTMGRYRLYGSDARP